jgi:hypothetical protein
VISKGLPGGVVSSTRVADAISQSFIVNMQLHCPKSSISGPKMIVHIPILVLYSMEYLQHNKQVQVIQNTSFYPAEYSITFFQYLS